MHHRTGLFSSVCGGEIVLIHARAQLFVTTAGLHILRILMFPTDIICKSMDGFVNVCEFYGF